MQLSLLKLAPWMDAEHVMRAGQWASEKKMGEMESARETKIYNKNLCDKL